MYSDKLPTEQIEKFRSVMNRAITALTPNLKPVELLSFSTEQLRLIAGALGSEGAGREVESYVLLEREKWCNEPLRRAFLDQLFSIVLQEIELLELYQEGNSQREVPLPSQVKVLNLDTDKSDDEMPIEEFLDKLRSISASSVFKR